jgi:cyanophycin synthetase
MTLSKNRVPKGKQLPFMKTDILPSRKGNGKRIERASHVPTLEERLNSLQMYLPPLSSYLWGFKTEDISLSLQTFIPSAAQTPGRMNIFEFKKFKVLIDFAHNARVMQVSKTFCKCASHQKNWNCWCW